SVGGHHRDGLRKALRVDRLEDGFERSSAEDHVDPLVPRDELLRQEEKGSGPASFGDEEAVRKALRVRERPAERPDHVEELMGAGGGEPAGARARRRIDHELERAGPPAATGSLVDREVATEDERAAIRHRDREELTGA